MIIAASRRRSPLIFALVEASDGITFMKAALLFHQEMADFGVFNARHDHQMRPGHVLVAVCCDY